MIPCVTFCPLGKTYLLPKEAILKSYRKLARDCVQDGRPLEFAARLATGAGREGLILDRLRGRPRTDFESISLGG